MRSAYDSSYPVRMSRPGRRTGKALKFLLVSCIIVLMVSSSIGNWLPGLASFFESWFPSQPISTQASTCPGLAGIADPTSQCPTSATSSVSNVPNSVGADAVPSLSLPKTVVSSLTSVINEGGVVQDSSQNLTLYNPWIALRLLGGATPHDELLGPGAKPLSSWLFWNVQANITGKLVTLRATSNDFKLLGTNPSGTSVLRTMHVSSGQYSGTFEIVYKASSAGLLKWNLNFAPDVAGQYQLAYSWSNVTRHSVLEPHKRSFGSAYDSANYTFDWSDVPSSLALGPSVSADKFSLLIQLGTVGAGHLVSVDPTIASNVGNGATAYTFERKIVYNSQSGYYFAFYHNGITVGYSSSPDGVTWSAQQSMPSGWPGYYDDPSNQVAVLSVGQTVIVASGDYQASGCLGNCIVGAHPYVHFVYGTMSGGSINWQTVQNFGGYVPTCQSNGSVWCHIYSGYRYVNIALSSTGVLVLSYNWWEIDQNDVSQSCQNYQASYVQINYNGNVYSAQAIGGSSPSCLSIANMDNDRSIIIPADSNGKVRIIYQYAGTNSAPSLMSTWYDGVNSATSQDTLQSVVPDNDQFSAVADTNYGQHLVYSTTDGFVTYDYKASLTSSWAPTPNMFGQGVSYPSVTVDLSNNNVYVLGFTLNQQTQTFSIIQKSKSLSQSWSDGIAVFPVNGVSTSSTYLTSTAISTSATNDAQIAAVWTQGTGSSATVQFAATPIQTVWSPFSTPALPWDGNGLSPNGQYFANLGESVSTSTGILTVRQTDLSVAGRGLNLEFTRVYTEPYSFLNCPPNCQPYLYESYPWAPMGKAWQLNFPWMNDTSQPLYIHLWNGQGFQIPSSFWSGYTATYDNHVGDNFRLVRLVNGTITLYDKSGTSYNFGTTPNYPIHALKSIIDATGNSTITFNYSNNLISCISDTVGRTFTFSYSSGLLQRISQVTGSCPPPGGWLRLDSTSAGFGWSNARATTTLSTSSSNDLIILNIYGDSDGAITSVTDNANLVWHQRFSQWVGTEYYAIASSPLSSDTITVSFQSTTSTPGLIAYGITGYNPTNPFDQSPSIPAGYDATTTNPSVSITLSGANEMVLGNFGTNGCGSFTAGSGFTPITESGGSIAAASEYEIVTGVATVTGTFAACGGTPHTLVMADAIVPLTGSVIRSVSYANNGQSLTSVTNPASRATSYSYDSTGWLLTQITYPTGAYDAYSYYPPQTLGTQAETFRVSLQQVMASSTSAVREFAYSYKQGFGDQITNSTVVSYNGTQAMNHITSYTKYAFSFLADVKNVTDPHGNLLSGDEQFFSVNGEIPKDVVLLSDGQGHLGSYTNYYSYDLWGNMIYSRKSISPLVGSTHESFGSYYNNAEPLGFNAFQDSFSKNQGTTPDNSWNVTNGIWQVNSGVYNGTSTKGDETTMMSWADIGKPDLSIQAQVYVGRTVNTTTPRVGIFTHFPKTGSYKWGVVFYSGGLYLLDEWNVWLAGVSCPLAPGFWYTLNMTVNGYAATGWATRQGQTTCTVSGTFPTNSPAAGGTAFGLYAGSYSALFDDVKVTTVTPAISGFGFSNSFVQNGAPGPMGMNMWLATTKPPGSGWNVLPNWLPASGWSQAYASQNYLNPPWGTISGWPDSSAQWIWSTTGADVSASLDPVWMRHVFSVPATTSLTISITCDNAFVLYIDGVQIGSGNNWQQTYPFPASVGPGLHVFAVNATNTGGAAGLLVSVQNSGSGQVIFRSDATAGPQIAALAGTAQFQNGIGSVPTETYNSYYPWGAINQTKTVYEKGPLALLLTSEKDSGGVWNQALTSNPITVVPNEGIVVVSQLYLPTCCSINDPPLYGNCDVKISDTLGITFTFVASTYTIQKGGVAQCLWVGVARAEVTGTISQTGFLYSGMQIFGYSNVAGFGTAAASGSPYGSYTFPYTVDLAVPLQNSRSSIVGFTEAGAYCTQGDTFTFTPQSPGLKQEQAMSFSGLVGAYYCGVDTIVSVFGDGEDIVNPSGPNTVLHYTTTISSNVARGEFSAVAVELIPITAPSSPQWITTSRTYDRYGNLASVVDARGNYTYFNYSNLYQNAYLTNQTQTLQPGSTKTTRLYSYNMTMGTMLSSVDPNGYNTTYQYDFLGRRTRINYPNRLGFTAYSYNDAANYVDTTNENGWHTRQIYDGLERLTTTETFLGITGYNETFRFDWQNKMTLDRDSLGNTKSYTYDALGRLVNATKPDGTIVKEIYNATASWVRFSDENGNYYCSVYDRLNRLVSVVENASSNCQAGIVTNYYYDETGDLTQITNANQKSTAYLYDNLGRLIQTIFPDGTTETFAYDIGGNLVKKVDQKQYTTLYSYDSMSRPSVISYCGPPVTTTTISSASYTYDKDGNLIRLQNKNATLTYTYDARSRTLSEKYAVNTNSTTINLGCVGTGLPSLNGSSLTYTVNYGYSGEVVANMTYPDGVIAKYAYDGLGRVLNVSQSGTGTKYATFTYYNCTCTTRIKGISLGDGSVANYTYDSLSRPATVKVVSGTTLLLNLSYAYGHTGSVSSITGSLNGASINEQYTYDQLNRITGATLTDSGTTNTLSYKYDKVGNRLNQTINGATTGYTINQANNELTASSVIGTSIAYSYDANGNLASQSVTAGRKTTNWNYAWTFSGQLVQVSQNGAIQGTYAYDGTGRRVESIESSSTFYAYLGTETLYENIVGGATSDYVFAGPLRIAKVSAGTVNYYHTDALGSTRLVTTTGKRGLTVAFADNYQPYGQENGTPTGSETYKFTGKPVSVATGLYYYYLRWYDPSIGRFISQDPFAGTRSNPQTLNAYVYVVNNPETFNDPKGKFLNILIGAIAGGLIGYVGCGLITGGWTSSTCAVAGLTGAAIGALAGATFGASLAVEAGAEVTAEAGAEVAAEASVEVASEVGAETAATAATETGATATDGLVNTADFWASVESPGTSLSQILGNGAIGAGTNMAEYSVQWAATGKGSYTGLAAAGLSGFISGAFGGEGFLFSSTSSTVTKIAVNEIAGEAGYLVGDLATNQTPTVGGMIETAAFSLPGAVLGAGTSDPSGGFIGGAIGSTQNFFNLFFPIPQ